MTREEAIKGFEDMKKGIYPFYPDEYFDMAIKALEQEPTTKNNLGVDKEQLKTMIRGLMKWYVKRDNTEVGEPNTAVGLLYDDVMFGIDRLPSVTPQEPRWIPCSERLPEEDTDVLVTLKCGLIGIMQKKLADDDNGEPCYIWQDFEGEEHEVIAWMPLPEPYREVEE